MAILEIDLSTPKKMEESARRLAKERYELDSGPLPAESDSDYSKFLEYLNYEREHVQRLKTLTASSV